MFSRQSPIAKPPAINCCDREWLVHLECHFRRQAYHPDLAPNADKHG